MTSRLRKMKCINTNLIMKMEMSRIMEFVTQMMTSFMVTKKLEISGTLIAALWI